MGINQQIVSPYLIHLRNTLGHTQGERIGTMPFIVKNNSVMIKTLNKENLIGA